MERQETKTTATGELLNLSTAANVVTLTANTPLTKADSGKVFLIGTDALVVTLPPTELGLEFTFINSGAAGNNIVTISPQAADGIAGTITLAASVVTRVGTVDVDLVNTKATSTKGNSAKIVGTGVAGTGAYYIVSASGIWS